MIRKLCTHAGCNRFRLEGHSVCERHLADEEAKEQRKREYFERKYHHTQSRAGSFYQSAEWKSLSRRLLNERKYCEFCGEYATDVHHIRPVADYPELALDENNLVVLCKACHARETERERKERKTK